MGSPAKAFTQKAEKKPPSPRAAGFEPADPASAEWARRPALPPAAEEGLNSPAQPLEPSLRLEMESRLGHSFGRVRVHTGPAATRSAAALDARAYTAGTDVVFGPGEYAPHTPDGRSLLAHELAHVIQQEGRAGGAAGAGSPAGFVGPTSFGVSGALEEQADSAAALSASGLPPGLTAALSAQALAPLGGSAPSIQFKKKQRQPLAEPDESTGEAVNHEFDEWMASLVSSLNTDASTADTRYLIQRAGSLSFRFTEYEGKGMFLSAAATANTLLTIYRTLHSRADAPEAQRAEDGALLLKEEFGGGLAPWTPERPSTVEQIPPFSQENLDLWEEVSTGVALSGELEPEVAGQASGRSATSSPSRDLARQVQAEATQAPAEWSKLQLEEFRRSMQDAARTGASSIQVSAASTAQRPTLEEEAAGGERGAGSDFQAGRRILAAHTLGETLPAIQAVLDANPETAGQQAVPAPNGETTLLDAARIIWYIGRHLYPLDRTGHILPGNFAYFIRGISLSPGVYFFGQFNVASTISERAQDKAPVLLRLDGGVQVSRGDIYPKYVLTSLIPLLEQGNAALAESGGIGIIITPEFGRKPEGSLDNVERAVRRAMSNAPWAAKVRLAQIVDNPLQEVIDFGTGLILNYLSRAIPVIGQGMMLIQGMQLVDLLGNAARVAAYADTDDEIDIAGQAIARFVAEQVIALDTLVDAGLSAGKRTRKAFGTLRDSGPPAPHAGSAPAVEAPHPKAADSPAEVPKQAAAPQPAAPTAPATPPAAPPVVFPPIVPVPISGPAHAPAPAGSPTPAPAHTPAPAQKPAPAQTPVPARTPSAEVEPHPSAAPEPPVPARAPAEAEAPAKATAGDSPVREESPEIHDKEQRAEEPETAPQPSHEPDSTAAKQAAPQGPQGDLVTDPPKPARKRKRRGKGKRRKQKATQPHAAANLDPATLHKLLDLDSIEGLSPEQLKALKDALQGESWKRIVAVAQTNKNEHSVKGYIHEELFLQTPDFPRLMTDALARAKALGIPAENVRLIKDVAGLAPKEGSEGGMTFMTDGIIAAEHDGKLHILTVLESKSPKNKTELARRDGEASGQIAWDFERFRQNEDNPLDPAPVLRVEGKTYSQSQIVVGRQSTAWVGVLPKGETLNSDLLGPLQDQFNFQLLQGPVSDQAAAEVARRIIRLLHPPGSN